MPNTYDKLIAEASQQTKNGRDELDARFQIKLQVAILEQLIELNKYMEKTSRLANALRNG